MHEIFMRQALALAREAAAAGEVPVGCVVVRKGVVVGRGRNRREEKRSAASHAEMEAIAQANQALGSWRWAACWKKNARRFFPIFLPACAGKMVDIRFKTFVTIDAGFLNNSPVS